MTTHLLIAIVLIPFTLAQAQAQSRLSRVVSTILHDDDTKTLSNRDLINRTMQQETYSAQDILQMKRIFQLDRQGKVLTGLAFDGSGKPLLKFKYIYDDLDRLKEEQIRDMKDHLLRKMITVYDKEGKSQRHAFNLQDKELSKYHREIAEHPERLEQKGKKVSGNQIKSKTGG